MTCHAYHAMKNIRKTHWSKLRKSNRSKVLIKITENHGGSFENHRMHQTSPRLRGESQSRQRGGLVGRRAVGHQSVRRVRCRRRASAKGSHQRLSHCAVHRTRVCERGVQVERVIEEGRQTVKANLPAVISVVQSIGEPRYPSFMGIRKASKATIPVWSLSDLGTSFGDGVSAPAPLVTRSELLNPPAREMTIDIITGDSPEAIAEKLVEKILAEKVL